MEEWSFLVMYNEMILLTTRDEKFGRNLIQSDCIYYFLRKIMILVYIIYSFCFNKK